MTCPKECYIIVGPWIGKGVVGGYWKAVRLLDGPMGGCFLGLCTRLAQLSSSGSSSPYSCSAGLWVRTSGRESLELERISRQMRLCQPSWERPPLPSAPDVITESVRGNWQFPGLPREPLCPSLGAGWEPGFLGMGACPFPFSLSLLGSMMPRSSTDALRVSPRSVMKGEAALVVRSSTVSPEFSHPH